MFGNSKVLAKLKKLKAKLRLRSFVFVEPILICWLIPTYLLMAVIENIKLENACLEQGFNSTVCSEIPLRIDYLSDLEPKAESAPQYGYSSGIDPFNRPELGFGDTVEEPSVGSGLRISQRIGDLEAIISLDTVKYQDPNVPYLREHFIFDFDIEVKNYEEITTQILNHTETVPENTTINSSPTTTEDTSNYDKYKKFEEINLYSEMIEAIRMGGIYVIKENESKLEWIFVSIKIITILFAGAASDKFGKRKPLILVPLFGIIFQCGLHLLASIIKNELSLEHHTYLQNFVMAICGDDNLLLIGIYTYLTGKTIEDDRTFRFALIPILSSKLMNHVFDYGQVLYVFCGPIYCILICISIIGIGILYCIFGLEEIEIDPIQPYRYRIQKLNDKKENFIGVDLFWSNSKFSYKKLITKPRFRAEKRIMFYLLIAYGLFICPTFGEYENMPRFNNFKQYMGFVEIEYKKFNTFTTVLFGTTFLTTVLSKFVKMPDTLLGMISLLLSIISKPIWAFSTKIEEYYRASAIDFLSGTRVIVTKSLITKFISSNEVGRIFAIFGVMYIVSGSTMPLMYETLYSYEFPGRYFFFSEGFLIPAFILFILTNRQLMALGKHLEFKKQIQFMKTICCKPNEENNNKGNIGKGELAGFIDLA